MAKDWSAPKVGVASKKTCCFGLVAQGKRKACSLKLAHDAPSHAVAAKVQQLAACIIIEAPS
jgi:hypothetical protein